MTTIAYIPARSHSTRLPGKNLRPVGGVPLVVRAVAVAKQARAIGLVQSVVVDTDDAVAEKQALAAGATVLWRPHELRGTRTRVADLVRYWLSGGQDVFCRLGFEAFPDLLCVLLPTSPLRTLRHLAESRLLLRDDADGVMSVTPYRQDTAYALGRDAEGFLKLRFDPAEVGPTFREDTKHDGTVIWLRSAAVLSLPMMANFYALKLVPYLVPSGEAVDVNEEMDLVIAEALLHRQEGRA